MYKEDNNIGFRCFPANHLTLMSKSKELLDRKRNNLCEWRESFFSSELALWKSNKACWYITKRTPFHRHVTCIYYYDIHVHSWKLFSLDIKQQSRTRSTQTIVSMQTSNQIKQSVLFVRNHSTRVLRYALFFGWMPRFFAD